MKIWKYSKWDSVLFAITIFQFAAQTIWAIYFDSLPLIYNLLILPFMVLLFYYNPIVATHNFLHTPYFTSKTFNKLYTIFNSGNLGLPQIVYKYHHITHHKYSNDTPVNSETKDPTSTYRFGKNGEQEHWFSYCALSHFRDGLTEAIEALRKRGKTKWLIYESCGMVAAWTLWCTINWQWFLAMYLPMYFAGYFLAYLENYFEHHHATDPTSRYANSVSYYNRIYNFFMFNEGYHQEHHIVPQRHWTERPQVTERFVTQMRQSVAHQSAFPPLLGFLDSKQPIEAASTRNSLSHIGMTITTSETSQT